MFRSVFFRRLFVPYLVLICVATGAVGLFAGLRLRSTYLESRRLALRDEAHLVHDLIGQDVAAGRMDRLNQAVRDLGREIGCRITVVRSDGRVLADNWADPREMENHGTRPEIAAAMRQGESVQSRSSTTIHADMLYLVRRIRGQDGELYYLRLALLLKDLNRELWLLYSGLGAVALFAMAAAGMISYQFARRQATPIVELTGLADALSRGELTRRTALSGRSQGEIGTLGSALNKMAQAIEDLLATAARDKTELLAILSSMTEGIIATDVQQQVVVVNDTAGRMLGFSAAEARGKLLWQIVRIDWIIKAAAEVLASGQRKVFEAGHIRGRHLEICLVPYPSQGPRQGLVLVAHDATQAVRYQELRKEFVANVSHELRTPLTVIKGYIETLRDGAIGDPVKAPEYLATMERHAAQLGNLVDDLLALSRLESQGMLPRKTPVDVASAAQKAIELLTPAATKKRIAVKADLPPTPAVLGNADYLERAVANLLDNAIKYTPEGGHVRVATHTIDGAVIVEVADDGIGIPEADLPRIFERFYRVDRSRSREMGGTGLGLSIVKHIAQAHGGSVQVDSTPGKGSVFRIHIPTTQPT